MEQMNIIEYLKNNLKIEVRRLRTGILNRNNEFEIRLVLDKDTVSSDYLEIPKNVD